MPTFTHGKSAKVFANGYEMSPYLSSFTSSGESDTADVSTLGTNAKAYIPGMKDATFSAEGFFAKNDIDTFASGQLGQETNWTMILSDVLGGQGFGERCIETTYEVGAEIGGAVAVTIEGQSVVGLERVRVLHPLAARTATGNGSSVDNGSSTSGTFALYVHVTAKSGTSSPGLFVTLQHSSDNSTWTDVATSQQFVAANQSQRLTATASPLYRYTRVRWTITGTTPSFTFHASLAR